MTFRQSPPQIRRYNCLRGGRGKERAIASRRKATSALVPTRRLRQMEWKTRMKQYDKTDSESRIQMLKSVCSIVFRKAGTVIYVPKTAPGMLPRHETIAPPDCLDRRPT